MTIARHASLMNRLAARHLATIMRSARWGAADQSEVLATTARITDCDADAWVLQWAWAAGELWSKAKATSHRGTGSLFLRAATYYGAALSQITHSAEHARAPALWQRQRACWDHAVELAGAHRIEIPFAGASLPGYFFPAPGGAGKKRPLVIMHNGAAAPTSAMWGLGGAAAAARGYHWMTFDGPGQAAALYERGLCFRPDWEVVLACVLDYVVGQPDIDADRITSVGVGKAGYLLPRALLHEHRLVAAVVMPGVVDASAPWFAALPRSMSIGPGRQLGSRFDRALQAELLFAPEAARWLRSCALQYGMAEAPPAWLFAELSRYHMPDDASSLRTPLLIVDSEVESPWSGQSQQLLERVGAYGTLISPPIAMREAHVFDWLDQIVEA